ncbi:MAG: hypothetical protein CVU54_16485 [Deltaproteobacteria bacterium HGW-Deltaproteobacteria-12]|nr:MAG: hypothetical protein CVU54_16485 [Deltaproteobacteria bacterium HGW-Deltaproteobacteria-12]
MLRYKIVLPLILVLITAVAYAASPALRWVSLSTDSRDTVREIIRSEVDNRESFSTSQEERVNLKAVEEEKERDDADYKNSILAANREFIRAKKKRDDATTQFQTSSTELDEAAKGIKTIRTTNENLDAQIDRFEQDIKTQKDSLKRWLQSEKQGEILVAVIYIRGFKDSAHSLESAADKASAPLIAQHMGTYIQSFTKVINNITTIDFIRATEEGTAKWNNEAPLRIELAKGVKGTSYLRLKRYELYPFQDNKSGKIKTVEPSAKYKVAIISSRKDLETFMMQNQFNPANYELNRANNLIRDTNQNNIAAEDGLNEQVKSFQERITSLQEKIRLAKGEKESQKLLLKRKEETYYKMSLDVAAIREKKDTAERQFYEAQAILQEKKRTHESIIIKTALATTKGSQSPAEASAEAILDKLAEVKNDAKTQHSSSTTEVTNFRVTAESGTQAITEARIIAVRLISFINEGDSVRVNMAFRVRTVLEDKAEGEPVRKQIVYERKTKDPVYKEDIVPESKPKPLAPSPQEKAPDLTFSRSYQPIATANALGCLFDLRSVRVSKDGIQVRLEVINTDADVRSVAFYDERFGNWTKSRIYDESDKYYLTAQAYVIQDNIKTLMYDLDRRGRGIAIEPNKSVSMELNFTGIPANVKTIKINLHPFIYYRRGWGQTWQEFDLALPSLRLYTEAQSPKPAATATIKSTSTPAAATTTATKTPSATTAEPETAPLKAKSDKKKKVVPKKKDPPVKE